MVTSTALMAVSLLGLGAAPAYSQADSSRIYGRVTTHDGDTYEGYIRWDKNEASWADILSATKRIPRENRREAERAGRTRRSSRSFEIFGIRIRRDWDWSHDFPRTAQSGIRFGQILVLESRGGDRARVVLTSGQEIEFDGGGDIGDRVREIVVDDARSGKVGLEWDDVRRVEFMTARAVAPTDERLYGTLTTRAGDQFTGWVAWDVDEVLASDVLDGEENGRDREIRFGSIASIERRSSEAARVRLKAGSEVVLEGTNDVDDNNRGITISDPGFGEVRVDWDEFRRLEFKPAPRSAPERFDGGRRLRGTVTAADGKRYTGTIRWDNDEEYGWEMLNGELNDVELDIEFATIAAIEWRSSDGARVRLRDGRTFDLSGSNDVDDDNKGIYIKLDDGRLVVVEWEDFRKLELTP